jgi:hypothetical protein
MGLDYRIGVGILSEIFIPLTIGIRVRLFLKLCSLIGNASEYGSNLRKNLFGLKF